LVTQNGEFVMLIKETATRFADTYFRKSSDSGGPRRRFVEKTAGIAT